VDPNYANRYRCYQNWHWWFQGREHVLRALLRTHLPPQSSRKIVSLGCGPAEGLTWLLDFARAGGKVVGCDVMPAPGRVPGVEIIVGRLEVLPFSSATFDLVLLLDVLEHLDDDGGALTEAARVLKPGGVLLATVPAMPSLWGSQDMVSHHRRRYTRRGLRDLFRRSGFPQTRISYFNTFLFPLVAAVRWTRALLGQRNRLRTDFEDNRPGAINGLLGAVFGLERHFVNHVQMPIGVSLFAVVSPKVNRAKGNGH
jgi:SAM-dependent methyltransferase